MLLVGIDEAGYGPILGPLVVTGTVFEIPDEYRDKDLWDILSASLCRSPKRNELRLPIADSKKLHNRKKGLTALEQTALVMLQSADRTPKTLRGLLKILSPDTVGKLNAYPWYDSFNSDIPSETTAANVSTRCNAVKKNMLEKRIKLVGVFSEILPAGHYNRQVTQTRNKATVLMELALTIVQRILKKYGNDNLRICVDRQGGREHYVEKLMTFFAGVKLRIIEETPQRSAYGLNNGSQNWDIEFATKGEDKHLPIALASIFSKYLRELFMKALNEYFAQRVENLAPTAGYYTDGKRFLADINAVIKSEQIDTSILVRSR